MEERGENWTKELRERTHKLSASVAAVDLRMQSLASRVDELSAEVRRMATADEIAKGVADELRRRSLVDRERVDRGMRRLVWVFGLVLTGLQIAAILYH